MRAISPEGHPARRLLENPAVTAETHQRRHDKLSRKLDDKRKWVAKAVNTHRHHQPLSDEGEDRVSCLTGGLARNIKSIDSKATAAKMVNATA